MLPNTSNKPITTDEELGHLIKMNGGATVPSIACQDYWNKILVADGYTGGGLQDRILAWSRANVITYKTPGAVLSGSVIQFELA